MLKSNLCDYSDAYVLVNGTITITGAEANDAEKRLSERNIGVIFKNCAWFTESINTVNNTQIVNAKDLDVVIPMYNLIEYSDNYLKTSGSLWQYYGDDQNNIITNSESSKFKIKITGKILLLVTSSLQILIPRTSRVWPLKVFRTSPSNVPRTSPKDPIWPSRERRELTSWGHLEITSRRCPNLTSKGRLFGTSLGHSQAFP